MSIARNIRILLVDDHTIVRQGLRNLLESYPNIEVVGEAGDGDEAVVSAAKLKPAVVVMDINMPKMDGITATRLIKTQHPEIAVVGLSVNAEDRYFLDAMQKILYAVIQRAVAAVQPVLILEEDVEQSDKPVHTDPVSMKEPKI